MNLEEHIETALRVLEREHDTKLAIFILRDLPETAKAGLTDIAWDLYRENCSESEVRWFIDELQKAQEGQEEVERCEKEIGEI